MKNATLDPECTHLPSGYVRVTVSASPCVSRSSFTPGGLLHVCVSNQCMRSEARSFASPTPEAEKAVEALV